MYAQLLEALETLETPTILVVGDLMLDRYLWGDVERVSPEAPVPVVQVDHSRTHTTVGGAGSVMRDLVALGAKVIAAGVVGRDKEGAEIVEKLAAEGVDVELVERDAERPTTQKTRVISRSNHLLRIDSEATRPLEKKAAKRLVDGLTARLAEADLVILSDYDKGVLSPEMISSVTAAARAAGKPVWADPARGRNLADFRGVSAITPNRKETEEATRLRIPPGGSPVEAAEMLMRELDLEVVVITLDSEGLYYRTSGGEQEKITAEPRAAHDVTGAGDMVVAAAGFGLAGGMDLPTALRFANFAAGMEVERIGAQPIPRAEVLRRLYHGANITSEKVLTLPDLKAVLEHRRRRGEKIVFTNGCFDILHVGHVKFLQFARSQGDLLVVGLNSDSSVRKIKGPPRPILSERERSLIIAGLETVDCVVIFDQDTPEALINEVLPDILVKGEDWRDKGVVGREAVESHGGKVILAPLVEGFSTTGVVERILKAFSGGKRGE